MPIYEFECKDCKKTFSVTVTINEHDKNPHPMFVNIAAVKMWSKNFPVFPSLQLKKVDTNNNYW